MAIRNATVLCPDSGNSGSMDLFKTDNDGNFISFVEQNRAITILLDEFGQDELTFLVNFIVEVIDRK